MIANWILYGFGAAICFSAMIIIIKKLLLLKIHPLILNMFLFGIVFVGFGIWMGVSNTKIEITLPLIFLLVLASFFSLLSNYCDVTSIKYAPNPDYASTLKAFSLVIIIILSALIFNSEFTITKFLGVLIVLFGIFLVSK